MNLPEGHNWNCDLTLQCMKKYVLKFSMHVWTLHLAYFYLISLALKAIL